MEKMNILKKISLLPYGLRYKLLLAFCLMSVIPLLIIGYLMNSFILVKEPILLTQASLLILFGILIAWLGLYLIKGIIERVIDIALETRAITGGNYDKKITIDEADEIGQIGEGINLLTKKIKGNMLELKDYQEKMKEINIDVQKRMSVLSNLLQISNLISSSVKMSSILELILSKISQLYEDGFAILYISEDGGNSFKPKFSYNAEEKDLLSVVIKKGTGVLGKVALKKKHVVMDYSSRFSSEDQELKLKHKCENVVAFPILLTKDVRAVLAVGNSIKNFTYTSDDIEMLRIFVEQTAIAIENDFLIKKAQKLEIKDDATDLYNNAYIQNRLGEEIKRSVISQRPCSFIVASVDGFTDYEKKKGHPQAEVALRKIAHLVGELSGPIGKAGRFEQDSFAVVIPEANKKEALEMAEKIRKKIEKLDLSQEKDDRLTVSCGIAENPLDGSNADEIVEKAKVALGVAKQKGKNKTVSSGG